MSHHIINASPCFTISRHSVSFCLFLIQINCRLQKCRPQLSVKDLFTVRKNFWRKLFHSWQLWLMIYYIYLIFSFDTISVYIQAYMIITVVKYITILKLEDAVKVPQNTDHKWRQHLKLSEKYGSGQSLHLFFFPNLFNSTLNISSK